MKEFVVSNVSTKFLKAYWVMVFIFLFNCVFSQGIFSARSGDDLLRSVNWSGENDYETELNKIEGNPYVNKDWVPCDFYYSDSKYHCEKVRYDCYKDHFEIELEGKSYYLLINKQEIDSARQGRQSMVPLFLKDVKKKVLAEIFHRTENWTILVYPYKKLKMGSVSDGYSEAKPPTFSRLKEKIYLKDSSGTLFEIGKLKDLCKIFPEKEKKIKGWFKGKTKEVNPEALKGVLQELNL